MDNQSNASWYKKDRSKKYYIVVISLLAIFLLFALQNTEQIELYFLMFKFMGSKAMIMFLAFAMGAGAAVAYMYIRNYRRKNRERPE